MSFASRGESQGEGFVFNILKKGSSMGYLKVRSRIVFALAVFSASFVLSSPAAEEWPEFRGPYGNGLVSVPGDTMASGIPLSWSETENVRWKIKIPHSGWSTPVVQNGQVWLTTAALDGKDFFVICVNAEDGKVVFNNKLFHCDSPEPLGNIVNGYASPSPAIEKGRVYVHFGSYGTACLDTSNCKVIWQRQDLPCRHFRGPGSSLIIFENLLILTMDGIDVQYMVALDKNTGKTIWKTDRTAEWNDLDAQGKPMMDGDFRKAYSTPLVADVNGKFQLLTTASKASYSYDVRTGKELWKIHHSRYSVATRPLFSHGLALISTGGELLAIKPDGRGDVTDTHVAWKVTSAVPRMSSPVIVDDLLYMVNEDGTATCLEVATGKQVWQERIRGSYYASPISVDGRVYFFSVAGKTTVLKTGRTYELLGTNVLDDGFMASPAVSGKALFLRTKTSLYRIESAGSGK